VSVTGRLLLVEDNELNRDMLSRRLRRAGFEVALAADGEEALAPYARDPAGPGAAGHEPAGPRRLERL
jgi:CheY-like chemotaxis protein